MGNFWQKFKNAFRHFMLGRYGTDKLNLAILTVGLILSVFTIFFRYTFLDLICTAVSYGLMFWAIFRCLSRNTYKRYQENRKYLRLLERWRDKDYRYFECRRCKQTVRVPRGKGKIEITCPKCKEKFIKKT